MQVQSVVAREFVDVPERVFGLGGVSSVAFSPDGEKALLGSEAGFAVLVDLDTGTFETCFLGHTEVFVSAAFSPDGTRVLTGSGDGTAKLWDAVTGAEIRTFSGHTNVVNSVAFSPDETQVLTGSDDETAKLWDTATGAEILIFSGHTAGVSSVAFSPDGTQALTGSRDATAKLWDAATGAEIRTFSGHTSSVYSVAFSPDGTQVLTGSRDATAKLWDAATGAEIRTFSGHTEDVNSVAFSPDGTQVLTGSRDSTAKLWETATGAEVHTLSGHTSYVNSVAFSPDGTQVLTGSRDCTAKLWETATGAEIHTFSGHTSSVYSVAFSPDGTQVLTGSGDDTAKLWDVATGAEIRTFSGHTSSVYSVAFSPDGTQVLTGSGDGTAKLWDAATGTEVRTFSGHTDWVHSVAFSPNGTQVLTGSGDGTAKLWDAATGAEIRTFSGHADWVSSVAFSPDGTQVLTGSGDGTANLWNAATGAEINTFIGHASAVNSVAFSPDGTQVLTGSWDFTAKLWDVATGHEIRTFSVYDVEASSVAFSPDGAMVLIGWGVSGAVTLSEADTGTRSRTFSHEDYVNSVAFSPDGTMVLTGGSDRMAKLWNSGLEPVTPRQPPVPLVLGDPVEDGVDPLAYRDYSLEMTAGQFLLVEVMPLEGSNQLLIYGRLGDLPALGHYDFRALEPTSRGTYELLISPTQDGTYYFSAFGRDVASPQGNFRITARTVERHLSDVTPRSAGNAGEVTLNLSGLAFVDGMQVELRGAGLPTLAAGDVTLASPTTLWARFDLTGATTGVYDVYAIWPGGEEEVLGAAFEVFPGTGAYLEAQITAPEFVRPGRQYLLWLEYINTGDADVLAPLFIVSSPDGTPLRLGDEEPFEDKPVQVLGTNPEGSASVLPPGASARIPVYFYVPPGTGDDELLDFDLSIMISDTLPINWDEVEDEVRPPDVNPEVWNVLWPALTAQIGDTWGDYRQALADNAGYLASLGRRVYSVRDLFRFEVRKALGMNPRMVLAGRLDAYAPAPGLPLQFGLIFPGDLEGRFRLGPLGRGWTHAYAVYLEELTDGDIRMHGPGSFIRLFISNGDGTYTPLPGDYGILTRAGGVFELVEKDATRYRFRADLQLDYIEDPNGNRITTIYDGSGRLIQVQHSSGDSLDFEYNAQGRLSRLTDHAGRATEYSYDATGEHLLAVTAPGIRVTTYTYATVSGQPEDHALLSIAYPDGTHQYYAYDGRGRLGEEQLDGGAERISYTYDAFSRIHVTDATGETAIISPDEDGRPAGVRGALGRKLAQEYNADFTLATLADPAGQAYAFTYDHLGNIIRTENPLGQQVKLNYDTRFSQIAFLEDARGNQSAFEYDDAGNLTTLTYPDGSQEIIAYDAAGNPISYTSRSGDVMSYTYDARGQLLRKDYPDGSWAAYAYDAAGNMTSASDVSGTITMMYDSDTDFMTRITYPSGRYFEYSYNDVGQRTQRLDQDGHALNYEYDAAGRLLRLYDEHGSDIVSYAYDGNGRLLRESKGNGTYTTYDYDAAGQLLHMVNYAPDDTVQSRFDYTYDANGNRTSMTTLAGTTTYDYDTIGQLIGVTYADGRRVTYTYDAAGNRTTVTDDGMSTDYTTNEMNQYTQVGTATYTYDAKGNMTSKTDLNGVTTYEYDAENRLIRVSTPMSGTWAHTYDALGNRVTVEHNGVLARYVHDPIGLVDVAAEYDNSGALVAQYIHGLGLVARIDAAGAPVYYAYDGTGHTRQLTSAGGAVVNSYDYTPFGTHLRADENVPNPFRFVGRFGVMTEGNGLNFTRVRFYDSYQGRFTSADPASIDGTLNPYGYCSNNPVSLADPDGREPVSVVAAVVIMKASAALGGALGAAAEIVVVAQNIGLVPSLRDAGIRIAAGAIAGLVLCWDPYSAFMIGIGAGKAARMGLWLGEIIDRELESKLLDSSSTGGIAAVDPNEKVGPAGYGEQHLVSVDDKLQYVIYFENKPEASAPAQEVFVTDDLDPDLDWGTFQLTEVAFGDQVVAIPQDTAHFYAQEMVLDYRAELNQSWWVEITAGVDYRTGRASWTFRTLDPVIEDLPADPFAGFLPPNDETGRGEGHVVFSVKPRSDLPDGTLITNQATIVFDVEAPITTNVVTNMIGTVPVNVPPVAEDDAYSTDEDTMLTIDAPGVLGNDSDADGDPLTVNPLTGPSYGVWTQNADGSFTYTPDENFYGTDSYAYEACDPGELCDGAMVTIMVNSVNDAPMAGDDSATTDEDTAMTIDVLANDTDVDNDTLTIIPTTLPLSGTAVINLDNTITYTPTIDFNGTDSFTYKAYDGAAFSNEATVTITVNPVNDAPECSTAAPSIEIIWPPNLKFTPVTVLAVTDPEGDLVTITIDSIFQDEPVGKGKHSPDGRGVGTDTAEVRAEREGSGNGRVYHIGFTAYDGLGGFCSAEVLVGVPHDQGDGSAPIDDGALYDSTVAN